MMSLKIKYGIKFEKQRIKNTLKNLSWYKKLGYFPCFPKKINPETDSLKEIYAACLYEYNEADYKKAASQMKKDFSKVENYFYGRLKKVFGSKVRKDYEVVLTKYGAGGSYVPPNKIIINIRTGNARNTIFHEIVHLMIEPYIIKYKIGQNKKERIVDLIMTSIVGSKKYKMQKRGEKYKFIDPLFKEYFQSPAEDFFKRIK